MVDATGMCGACMVPVTIDGKMVRKHACVDGPELDAHSIDWDKFLPRFNAFRTQEEAAGSPTGWPDGPPGRFVTGPDCRWYYSRLVYMRP